MDNIVHVVRVLYYPCSEARERRQAAVNIYSVPVRWPTFVLHACQQYLRPRKGALIHRCLISVTLSLEDNYKSISIQSCSVGHQHIPIFALRSGMFFNNSQVAHQLHWLGAHAFPTCFVDHLFPHCGPRSCWPLWLEVHAYHSAL